MIWTSLAIVVNTGIYRWLGRIVAKGMYADFAWWITYRYSHFILKERLIMINVEAEDLCNTARASICQLSE